jgi:hypothetical protein
VYPEDAGASGVLPFRGKPEATITQPDKPDQLLRTDFFYDLYGNLTGLASTGTTDGASKMPPPRGIRGVSRGITPGLDCGMSSANQGAVDVPTVARL